MAPKTSKKQTITSKTSMERLDKKAVWIFFVSFFYPLIFLSLFFLPFAIITLAGAGEPFPGFFVLMAKSIPVFLGAYVIFCAVWARLTYHYYFYELTESSFKQESGVIWKKYVSIPYDRIQNVNISRGPLDRILGISSIHIQTAGMSIPTVFFYRGYRGFGGADEGILPGLSREKAEQLRKELIDRVNQSKNQGL